MLLVSSQTPSLRHPTPHALPCLTLFPYIPLFHPSNTPHSLPHTPTTHHLAFILSVLNTSNKPFLPHPPTSNAIPTHPSHPYCRTRFSHTLLPHSHPTHFSHRLSHTSLPSIVSTRTEARLHCILSRKNNVRYLCTRRSVIRTNSSSTSSTFSSSENESANVGIA